MIYNILEVANAHGGNFDYLISLIDEFKIFNKKFGIKFQPFKYNEIALPDYKWYPVYEELYFSPEQWKKIIFLASKHKDIWIDVLDAYSIIIIKNNLNKIHGIKLQASVLYNRNVLNELSVLELSNKIIILNISGYQIKEIEIIVSKFKNLFKFSKIILQIGFQGYPTKINDAGMIKIEKIQSTLKMPLAFADHIDANDEDAIWLPIFATVQGVEIIEKHIRHSTLETKYDHFSSITVDQYQQFVTRLEKYTSLFNNKFITDEEKKYLKESNQIPIIAKEKKKGDLLTWNDFIYKRTDKKGMSTRELEYFIENGCCLKSDIKNNSAIDQNDINKVKVAAIIAVRLKSSRLKKKALKKIGNLTSIEYCIKNVLKFKNVDFTIVASSYLEEDKELENYKYRKDVIFHKGDPEDVIKRYLDIIRKLKIDVIVRITGDMPFVSNDVLEILLKSHFNIGADYTVGREAAVGTNLEIINSEALERVHNYFPTANYSEYMTWYFQNNPEHFKLNFVDLPREIVRNYRLTLDYKEDLIMFNAINNHFIENNLDYNIYEMFDFLDNNPDIASINSKLPLTYKTDTRLIDTLNNVTKIKS